MRTILTLLLTTTALWGSHTSANDALHRHAVKTGILPSGGFFRIYEVACPDNRQANIVSLGERSRWCTGTEGALVCFKRSRLASEAACGADNQLAATAKSAANSTGYQ
jgi:hypothetical protein